MKFWGLWVISLTCDSSCCNQRQARVAWTLFPPSYSEISHIPDVSWEGGDPLGVTSVLQMWSLSTSEWSLSLFQQKEPLGRRACANCVKKRWIILFLCVCVVHSSELTCRFRVACHAKVDSFWSRDDVQQQSPPQTKTEQLADKPLKEHLDFFCFVGCFCGAHEWPRL